MDTKYLNSLVYDHLLQVDKLIAEQFKKEVNVTKILPESSPRIVDMVRHFKKTGDTDKLELVEDNHEERKKSKKVKKVKSSLKTVDMLCDLLCDSNIEGLKPSKVPKIVQMIADEIGMEELGKISHNGFIHRAENIIKMTCTILTLIAGIASKLLKIELTGICMCKQFMKKRTRSTAVKFAKNLSCLQLLRTITMMFVTLNPALS